MKSMIRDDMIKDICRLISIESVSGQPEGALPFGRGPYEALQAALDICSRLGMETKLCGPFTGYAQAGSGERLIAVLAHVDVVPAGEGWETPPFQGIVKDGRLYGRGALDDKGPAVAAIYALHDLQEELRSSGHILDKRVRIIFGCSEEKGEWTDMAYYLQTEEAPDAGFTPDADFPVIFGEKGIAEIVISFRESEGGLFSVSGGSAVNVVPSSCCARIRDSAGTVREISGQGVPAHGSTPEKGKNAIFSVMRQLQEMNRVGQCSSAFADFYMNHFADSTDGSLCGCFLRDDVSGQTTVNPGLISMEGDTVKLHLDIRYPVSFTGAQVLAGLRRTLGDQADVSLVEEEKPLYIEEDSHLIRTLADAYTSVTGDTAQPAVIGGGTYARAMNNIAAFGPVFPGRECTEHQCNEYIELEDLYTARRIYKEALKKL
ncbi:MAG: Sapep family Mn(2+)-dependent dipeptidase [Emergencia sp.]